MTSTTLLPLRDLLENRSFLIQQYREGFKEPLPSHLHDYHELHFVEHGSGVMFIDERSCEILNHSCFCIWQGQVHKTQDVDQGSGFSIMFKHDFIRTTNTTDLAFHRRLFKEVKAINYLKPSLPQALELKAHFKRIFQEFEKPADTFGRIECLQVLLLQLLVMLARLNRKLETHDQYRVDATSLEQFQAFQVLLEEHFRSEFEIKFYAKKLGVSRRKLNEILRSHTTKTFKKLLVTRRCKEAKSLLELTDHSLKEIAFELGFKSQSYFCYTFKKSQGLAAREYRASYHRRVPS